MFPTPKQSCQPMAKKGRRNEITLYEIDWLKQTITSTPNAKRPFVFDPPAAPAEEVQKMILLTATNTFGREEYLTQLAPAKFWHINFALWTNKMDQAKEHCIIYKGKLTVKEIENIWLIVCKYICFMSTLPDYTECQLEETEMMLRKLYPPLYNMTTEIPWIARK